MHPAHENDPYDAVHHALASGEGLPDAPEPGPAADPGPRPAVAPCADQE